MFTSDSILRDKGFEPLEGMGQHSHLALTFFTFMNDTFAFNKNGRVWFREGRRDLGPDYTEIEPILWEKHAEGVPWGPYELATAA